MRIIPVLALLSLLLVPVDAAAAPNGNYYLQSAVTGQNAAVSGSSVVQHRPKGNEDRQQFSWNGSTLAEGGLCLGRSGDAAQMVSCSSAEAKWVGLLDDQDRYRFKDPGADRYLIASGTDQIRVGTGNDRWFLTPVNPVRVQPPADPRLDEMTFLTSHNAYANGVDGGFMFANIAPNQSRGIVQQLNDGVRGFMLDIHQTPDGAILCHNSCTAVSRPVALNVDIQRIVDFLKARPTEIVTVFLEDYVSADVLRNELARVQGLGDVLFRAEGVRENGWPTLSQMRASGKRLLIFTDHSRDGRENSGVLYQRDWTVENYWSMGSGTGTSDWSCYSRWGEKPLTATETGFRPLFVMNHFRDVPMQGTVATDNSKLVNRAQRFCEPAARKTPNYLAVDFYHLNTPSLPAERHPSGAGSVALSATPTLCLDNDKGGTANGNPVQIWGCNNTYAQKWRVVADGTIAIAGKCLDVDNGGTTNGTSVQLWECNGTGAQQWRVRSDGSAQNPQSGLCLDNPGASTTPGTRLNIWSCNGSAAQAWKFR
ncbi:Ricin-type beta-trefoil lectin domain-containing protein [Lentzea albidocapillata subsp. violacea]|uniref:Ricin-type beta-trefoil lectin domain-containing protein n=1 Tax=Lentzea albidocapillata subsp. violacea TaxID=128104 RepID=A0A1G8XJ16_9PSEU|nr:PI-PLC domain-containing protein [Lentzea albidocapillata]SDJ89750.1 Ricin-type beta-trefoil lectin domain-containing protein [Lentzea albidocapillata subsp. violacea]